MGVPTYLDVAIAAPAVILGLLGVWLGFVRSSVAFPMRWVVPLIGAYAAGRLAELALLTVWEMAGLAYVVGPPVGWVALTAAFLATLIPLLMFMDNLIARVAVWTAGRRTGLGERVLGALLGTACGFILVAAAIEHSPIRRATAEEPAWARESALLPYVRGVSQSMERALAFAWPYAMGARRWRW